MAVHVYKYTDSGAPDLAAEPNGQSLQALLEHILPTHGWTIVHDSTRRATGTSTDGRIIFKRPNADFVFWMDNDGSSDFIVGLAQDGFATGDLAHPQSYRRQSGTTQQQQKVDDSSSIYWTKWVALYDDASDTLIYKASNTTYAYHGASSAAQPWGYIGTMAVPQHVPFDVPALFMGVGTIYSTSVRHGLNYGNGTTLVQYDGSPSSDDTRLYSGSGLTVPTTYLSAISTNGGPAFPYIPMTRLGISCTSPLTGGGDNDLVEVGVLRGCLVCPSVNSSNAVDFFAINFPAEAAGNSFDNPIVIAGTTYYTSSTGALVFISDDPADWVL